MQRKKNNFNPAIRDPEVPTQLELLERLEPLEQVTKHPFREPMLFRIASVYEIATRHRMSPGCSIARPDSQTDPAVGSLSFVNTVKSEFGFKAAHRKVIEQAETYVASGTK